MKRHILTLAALAATSTAAYAEELSFSAAVGYESKYVFRGMKLQDASIQPGFDVAYGGFYAGVWSALSVDNVDDDGLELDASNNEVDFYAGFGGSLTETVGYDIGATYYYYPSDDESFLSAPDAGTYEVYGGLSFDTVLAPSLYVFYDFNLDAFTVQGDAGYSFPLSEDVSFDVAGQVGYVADPGDNSIYGAVTADLAYAVSDDSSLYVGGRFGGSEDSASFDGDASGFWFGLGFSTDL